MVYGKSSAPAFPNIAKVIRAVDGRSLKLVFADVSSRLHFIAPGESDFTVEDEQGFAPIRRAACVARDRVSLQLARPVSTGARVHSGWGANPTAHLRDAEQNTPVLAFHGVPVS